MNLSCSTSAFSTPLARPQLLPTAVSSPPPYVLFSDPATLLKPRAQVTFPLVGSNTLAVSKYPLLSLLTNVGASGTPAWDVSSDTGYDEGTELIDALTCTTYTAGSSGSVSVTGSSGDPVVSVHLFLGI